MRSRAIPALVLALLVTSCAAESQSTPITSSSTAATSSTTTTTTTTTTPPTTASTTTTMPVAVPAGYELVEIKGESVRLALPQSWVIVDLTQEDWEELLTEGFEEFPEAAALVGDEGQAIINQGGLLLAYDFEHQDDDFITNLNLLSIERGPLDDPEVIVPVLTEQLTQIGVENLAIDLLEVPLGSAIKAAYGMPPETGFTHTAIQYYMFGPDTVYIITFSTEHIIELEFTFDTIVSTFDTIG